VAPTESVFEGRHLDTNPAGDISDETLAFAKLLSEERYLFASPAKADAEEALHFDLWIFYPKEHDKRSEVVEAVERVLFLTNQYWRIFVEFEGITIVSNVREEVIESLRFKCWDAGAEVYCLPAWLKMDLGQLGLGKIKKAALSGSHKTTSFLHSTERTGAPIVFERIFQKLNVRTEAADAKIFELESEDWLLANVITLRREAQERAASLDETLRYVEAMCSSLKENITNG
jgi:hypothetical protein